MTQGESNWGQTGSNEVKPAGDSTPARPDAVEGVENRLHVMVLGVGRLYEELLFAHS